MARTDGWLTTDEVIGAVGVDGLSVSKWQLRRWREARLLPGIEQAHHQPGSGSVTWHHPDTPARVIAIGHLQKQKDDLAWIGRQLWWQGASMPEQHWRPALLETATKLDPVFRRLNRVVGTERGSEDDDRDAPLSHTAGERLAPHFGRDIISSRIVGRVSPGQLATVLRIVLHSAAGFEPEYEWGDGASDSEWLVRGLDLRASSTHVIAGQTFGFSKAITGVFASIATAMRGGTLTDAAEASAEELGAIRDDLRRGMEIACVLYDSTRWLFGPEAFGLRMAAWVSRKAPPSVLRLVILVGLLLRRTGLELLPSEEIAESHHLALQIASTLALLKDLYEREPEYADVLAPKRLKKVLAANAPSPAFLKELHRKSLVVAARRAKSPGLAPQSV